ncbi:DUF4402 domain-containing protein [Anaeromyxobacter diazotrophicus]|uniref:DUF4402 domain-containing protein n=1 Tax=Anaeromyxobacter diazotrophicus TaxID=2590199 RepID=A0A7I9VLS3_9BACT|nr:DUF4402 domain-containing protein [Anaeromyxobacter diazotrophicus]GEJ57363.1 hypothetical protein AMYX_21040 [Anaeromyxobacter diazotrophicus]
MTARRRWLAAAAAVVVPCLGAALGIAVAPGQGLSFGAFAAGSGGAVTVSPTGSRAATGGVVLLSARPGAAATFTVTGDPGLSFGLTLPADGAVALTSGAHAMALSGFTYLPATLSLGAGSQVVSIGATLAVGAQQAPGSYAGTFDVTVNYQ